MEFRYIIQYAKLNGGFHVNGAIMTTKAQQGGGVLTASADTGITPTGATNLTPGTVTKVTPKPVTKRAYKKRARKCACGCGRIVEPTPQAPHKVYFDDACRQRGNRAKKGVGRPKAPRREVKLDWMHCDYCGLPFVGAVGVGTKYCKPSHKVAAAEARRESAIDVLMQSEGLARETVQDVVKRTGMRKISAWLKQEGYIYSEQDRRWLLPVSVGAFVEQGR